MMEVIVPVAGAALVGSLHCTSMCGGLAAFGSAAASRGQKVAALSSYNAARGAGYTLLGTLAGALGSTLDDAGARVGFGRVAGAVAGVVMIAWGLARIFDLALPLLSWNRKATIHVPIARLVKRLRDESPVVRSAVVGGCTAALPCGFLHAFLVAAAGTGSAAKGALVMAAFWAGTLPAMAGLGAVVGALSQPLRRHASLVGAVALVFFGVTSLLGRWAPASLLDVTGAGSRATPSVSTGGGDERR
jgi:sulfite exporter TauE/SafE